MAFTSKKKKEDRFSFSPQARAAFAKEMVHHAFDFDAFLIAKGALVKRKGSVIALEYEGLENQTAYVSKFIRNTAYFSFEAGTLNWAWLHPFAFWFELRSQSWDEESKALWECDRLESTRTGQPREARARKVMRELAEGMEGLIGMKTYA